jgi:RimJ/RimL family protein N-acetyltransferase
LTYVKNDRALPYLLPGLIQIRAIIFRIYELKFKMIQTSRLILTELTHSDYSFIVDLLNSPGWLQYIGDRNVHTREQAEGYLINGPIKSYKEFGYGLMKVSLLDTHQPIGICGLLKRETLPHPDLGFAFLPQYNGQGFAMEAANVIVQHVRKKLGVQTILAVTLPDNQRSIQLLEKLRFQYESDFSFPGNSEKLSLYKSQP